MKESEGYEKGETCNRDGCGGTIDEHHTDSCCSCHSNPPCSHCTDSRGYCTECGWDGREDQVEAEKARTPTEEQKAYWSEQNKKREEMDSVFRQKMAGKIPVTEIDYRIKGHTHSSQICEGVYPEGTTKSDVESITKGSWGGRFEHFGRGTFRYIAYTD